MKNSDRWTEARSEKLRTENRKLKDAAGKLRQEDLEDLLRTKLIEYWSNQHHFGGSYSVYQKRFQTLR